MIKYIVLLILLTIGALYISSPTEADIQACMDHSNMAYDTCLFTLKS